MMLLLWKQSGGIFFVIFLKIREQYC